MKSKWKEYLVSDIGRIVTGKTPKTTISEYYGGDIPFLTPSDDMSVKYVLFTSKTITEAGKNSVKNSVIPANSICVSCIGSELGKVVITTKETITNQQINSIIVNTEFFDIDFIYYSMILLGKILNYYSKTSTAIPIINKNTFSQYKILCPELSEQKKIASILSPLDAKIELNNAINENLEQQAQSIFDNIFPNVSRGEKTIGEYIIPKHGKSLISKNAIFGNVPVIAGGLEPATYHNIANTIAPVVTISASGANAGYVNLWNIPVWSSDSSFIDLSMTNDVYFWYVMLKKRQAEIFDSQTGSVQPHVFPKHIAILPTMVLNQNDISYFTYLSSPLFNKIGYNKIENQRLASIRDTLLPKLMKGEIDVSKVKI